MVLSVAFNGILSLWVGPEFVFGVGGTGVRRQRLVDEFPRFDVNWLRCLFVRLVEFDVQSCSHAAAKRRRNPEHSVLGAGPVGFQRRREIVGSHHNRMDDRRVWGLEGHEHWLGREQNRGYVIATVSGDSRYYFNSTPPYRKCAANRETVEEFVSAECLGFVRGEYLTEDHSSGQVGGRCVGRESTDVTAMTDEHTTILVVDDEQDIADLYTTWLEMDHDVRTAYGGEEALEKVDTDVDIVFLDRQMPDYSGDEVLEQIREQELDCRVVMVTAVDPDFDIVSMEFDDYLTKPVMREDLNDAVDSMLERDEYNETLQEYFALTSKKATLEAEKTPSELQESTEYQEMVARVEELESEADTAVSGFDDDFDSLFQEFPGGE